MSSTARSLRAVSESPAEVYGDPSLTQEAMSGWTAGQRRCRARKRHNWGPHMVYDRGTYFDVLERCTHCSNRRSADFSKIGRKLTKWKPDYRDGYLLPKGASPIDEDAHDELMLTDILSRKIVDAPSDDEEQPRRLRSASR